jgi:hypothetical protein
MKWIGKEDMLIIVVCRPEMAFEATHVFHFYNRVTGRAWRKLMKQPLPLVLNCWHCLVQI